MSKTKEELKSEIQWLQDQLADARTLLTAAQKRNRKLEKKVKRLKTKFDDSEQECNKYFISTTASGIRVHALEQELEFTKAMFEISEQHQEKPWTRITDDPGSLPKESGWYQIYHETDIYSYPVMPCFYSEGAWEKGFILAWKPLSKPPQEGES